MEEDDDIEESKRPDPNRYNKEGHYQYQFRRVKYVGCGTDFYVFQIIGGAKLEIEPGHEHLIFTKR